MPRRDGTPTDAEILAQQQGTAGPPPPTARPGTGGVDPAEASQNALALVRQAARAARRTPGPGVAVLTPLAVSAAAASILGAFDRFMAGRRDTQSVTLTQILEHEIPELPETDRFAVIEAEMAREQTFTGKMRERLNRDLPLALSISDPDVRRAQVEKLLAREQRYVALREAAMQGRALGTAEQRHVEQVSPEGGYWHLSPHVREHTVDCLAMGGKVWPHSVLRTYHPPLHGECPCEVWPIQRAHEQGLLGPGSFASHDQSVYALQIAEADFDDEALADEMAILEVAYDRRWAKGTTKAGEFRPKRGGDPGAVLRARRLHRLHMHDVAPVQSLGHELDVHDIPTADVKPGDRVMVNGELEHVTHVDPKTPGLITLEHSGLVHISRDTVRGVAGDAAPAHRPESAKVKASDIKVGDSLHEFDSDEDSGVFHSDGVDLRRLWKVTAVDTDEHGRVKLTVASPDYGHERRTFDPGHEVDVVRGTAPAEPAKVEPKIGQVWKVKGRPDADAGRYTVEGVTSAHVALRSNRSGRATIELRGTFHDGYEHESDGAPPHRPELPTPGVDDRYELRYRDDGTLEMFDREHGKPYATWDAGAFDIEAVKGILDEHNADHRDRLKASEPPPPSPTGGPSHADVLALAKMRKPDVAGELAPGFHFNPDIARSENRDGHLHVPAGFFKQSKAVREKVLFRHLGSKLADDLGPGGQQALKDQHPHLASKKAIVDTYAALNSSDRPRIMDIHPDASRLVATAAVERGLPLHPEAAKLARRPAAIDAPAADHPVHDLARQVEGLTPPEVRSLLGTAGYQSSGGENGPDGSLLVVYRNFDVGSQIATTIPMSGSGVGVVSSAKGSTFDAPSADDEKLIGFDTKMAESSLRARGFATNWTSVAGWMVFDHPEGYSLAIDDHGGRVGAVRRFQSTPSEQRMAQAHVVRQDPLAAIHVGDDLEPIHKILDSPGSPYHATESAQSGVTVDGVDGYVTYGNRTTDGEKAVTVHYRNEGGKRIVVRAGLADPRGDHAGEIVSEFDHATHTVAERERRDEAARKAKAEREGNSDKLRAALEAGDAKAIKALLTGKDIHAAHAILQTHGFEARARKRSRVQGRPFITYTFRGPNAVTLKIRSGLLIGQSTIDKIDVEGPPQAQRRRLTAAPKNVTEMLEGVLGRSDQLAERFGGAQHNTGVVVGGVSRGAAAHREYNGTIAIRKGHEHAEITSYLKRWHDPAKRAELTDRDHIGFYNHVETLQHEINHGVTSKGEEPGGLSRGARHHATAMGTNIEEALVEETAHVLAADWLREMGMTDVLAAVKRNPSDARVQGVYRKYRVQLKRVLNDARVPPDQREALLMDMKFRMSPEQQRDKILELSGESNINHAMMGHGTRETAAQLRQMEQDFQSIIRPNLDDIDASVEAKTVHGRTITVGDDVMVGSPSGGPNTHGTIVEISGEYVKVRGDDGVELWAALSRLT